MSRTIAKMFRLLLAVVVLVTAGMAGLADSVSASATQGTTDGTTSVSAQKSAQNSQKRTVLSLDEATPVVTADSGYHVKLTVTNTGSTVWGAGRLRVFANSRYTFRSRQDMQEWAQGDSRITARTEIGGTDVPQLAPGQSATVNVDVPANAEELAGLTNWGAKPVLVRYQPVASGTDGGAAAGNGENGGAADGNGNDGSIDPSEFELHTFLTKSPEPDSANGMQGQALRLTMTLPLQSQGLWTTDAAATERLLTKGTDTNVVTLNVEKQQLSRELTQLISSHDKLQVLADPTLLEALAVAPHADAVTQPTGFDITAYSAKADAQAYESAGVAGVSWTADAALADYRKALGDNKTDVSTIATQGAGQWTLQALTEAKRQGYDTVIAGKDFEERQTATVHNAKTLVSTDAGDVAVLVEQNELGTLAKGKATNRKAAAERSAAGRVARFMAQSAFYQTEEPYNTRNLLVCLSTALAAASPESATAAKQAAQLMQAVESAPWLQLTDLDTLTASDPYQSGFRAADAVPTDDGISNAEASSLNQALDSLADSRQIIARVNSSVLAKKSTASNDAQALARQDASEVTNRQLTATQWVDELFMVHDQLAIRTLAGQRATLHSMAETTRAFCIQLLAHVTITPTEAVTVVSETAQMPVTVSNKLAYPVKVRVSSITDSMEIVTSRTATTTVPANGEAQVAFTVRVSTSSAANATLSLHDREGHAFGATQTTEITSVLRISDKTGFIIIAMAVVMAVLGLWRQFHRKKDPDE